MQQYRFGPEGLKAVRRTGLMRTLPIMIGTLVLLFIFRLVNPAVANLDFFRVFLPIFVVIFSYSMWRAVNRLVRMHETFILTIDDHIITREMEGTVPLSLHIFEIKSIVKKKDGMLSIRGEKAADIIQIPTTIEQYDELEQALRQLHPFEEAEERSFLERFRWVFSILIFASIPSVYLVDNKFLVIIFGTISVGVWLLYFILVQRNPNITSQRRKSSWIALVGIAFVLYAMYTKLRVLGLI
jgi:hypothetical protein